MKVMVKPKKMLLHLFKKQGGIEDDNGWWFEKYFFNTEMFEFCSKEIEVKESIYHDYDYDFCGEDWQWRKEWLVPISLKEDKQ